MPPAASGFHDVDNSDVELSIAPTAPTLTGDRAAFAVRLTCTRESPGSTGSTTEVFLFDWQGDALVQVLGAVLDRMTFDRVSGKETSEHGTLMALASSTLDYKDLSVRVKRVERTALLEAEKDSEATTQRRVLLTVEKRYRWNGRRYEPLGRRGPAEGGRCAITHLPGPGAFALWRRLLTGASSFWMQRTGGAFSRVTVAAEMTRARSAGAMLLSPEIASARWIPIDGL